MMMSPGSVQPAEVRVSMSGRSPRHAAPLDDRAKSELSTSQPPPTAPTAHSGHNDPCPPVHMAPTPTPRSAAWFAAQTATRACHLHGVGRPAARGTLRLQCGLELWPQKMTPSISAVPVSSGAMARMQPGTMCFVSLIG